jgi:hypothetical protein
MSGQSDDPHPFDARHQEELVALVVTYLDSCAATRQAFLRRHAVTLGSGEAVHPVADDHHQSEIETLDALYEDSCPLSWKGFLQWLEEFHGSGELLLYDEAKFTLQERYVALQPRFER